MSRVIAAAALAREDSRGAHFREDLPAPATSPRSTYIVVQRQAGDAPRRCGASRVRFTRVDAGTDRH